MRAGAPSSSGRGTRSSYRRGCHTTRAPWAATMPSCWWRSTAPTATTNRLDEGTTSVPEVVDEGRHRRRVRQRDEVAAADDGDLGPAPQRDLTVARAVDAADDRRIAGVS